MLLKGTYVLFVFPEEKERQMVCHKNTAHWGDGRTYYEAQEEALRLGVIPIKTLDFQENLLLSFDDISHNEITLIWECGSTKVLIPIKVDTQLLMKAQIQNNLKSNPAAQTYFEVARYYQEQ